MRFRRSALILSRLNLQRSIGSDAVSSWHNQKNGGQVAPHFAPDARLELVLGPVSQIVDLTPLPLELLLVRIDLLILVVRCIFPAL